MEVRLLVPEGDPKWYQVLKISCSLDGASALQLPSTLEQSYLDWTRGVCLIQSFMSNGMNMRI